MHLKIIKIFQTITFVTTCSSACSADEAPEHQAITLHTLSNLYGTCLGRGFNAELGLAFAKDMGWERLPPPLVEISRPPAALQFFEGFVAIPPDEPGVPFFVFFGRTADPTDKVDLCYTFFNYVDPTDFIAAFVEETDAILVDEDKTFSEIETFYRLPAMPDVGIKLVRGRREGDEGIQVFTVHER